MNLENLIYMGIGLSVGLALLWYVLDSFGNAVFKSIGEIFNVKFKMIVITLGLLTSLSSLAQDKVSISAYQDPSMALFKDDAGNQPYTFDMVFRGELQGKQFDNYYFFLLVDYEHAELFGGDYDRFNLGIGWTFNKLSDKFEYSPSISYGILNRFGGSFRNIIMINGDVSYKLNNNFKLSLLGQLLNREDLRSEYNERNYIRFSGYVGIKYVF